MSKFYLGMDIGTDSVGIACTDENYNLLRAKGQDCWATRLMDESVTSVERRTFRTARRRLERRKNRIKWLQGLFAPFIDDKLFFIRLNNSQFFTDDKNPALLNDKNALFADADYDDKAFHADYPTVYHLRKACTDGRVKDLRLYYLAIHHIVKYRGHFLFEGGLNDVRDFSRLITELNEICVQLFDDAPQFDLSAAEQAKAILLDSDVSKKEKQEKLTALFGAYSLICKEMIKGICGLKMSPAALFGDEFKEEKSFSVADLTDEAFDATEQIYGDYFTLLSAIRAVTSYVTFEKLLSGQPDISSAMIAVYEKHKRDLAALKDFVKRNADKSVYNAIFRSTNEKCNYANYVGFTKNNKKKRKAAHCGYDDFLAFLKKTLSELAEFHDADGLAAIMREIENKTFLPQILHSDNGLFPNQVNKAELDVILANMVKAYPETQEIAEKTKKLFAYRIPYYVGPLAGVTKPNGEKTNWAVKKSDEKITPWNFDKVIDFEKSNEAFMRRMTNKCTYLHGEDVLPKASVAYQKFNVLNQLNKLRVNGRVIPVDMKQRIYEELFLTKIRVTDKAIKDFLVRNGYISEEEKSDVSISGKDGEFNASMSSYIQLKRILGDFADEDLNSGGQVCENIILWHTLNTDKNLVAGLIETHYGDIKAVKDNVKALKGLTFKDFGKLSAKFLNGLKTVDKETGELLSITDVLYNTSENLNEILFNDKYDFKRLIDQANGADDEEITYEDLEDLYVSPAVRRGIWQSLTMCDEYVKALGRTPDKIFVEVTREDGVKGDAGRTESRKKKLSALYKNIDGIEEIAAELDSDSISDMKLRQERLYLYFRQLGRCMYSGERINLDELNTDLYDVDHILPRTFLKDDGLDNKVLVKRSKNAEKSDRYPLPPDFTRQQDFWKFLRAKNLIGEKTLKLLTRTEPLNDDDFNGFINRQKVITDQTVKCVAELLSRKYPESKIVYSKAKNVSDFRHDFKLHKCRETNDLHHARDAYLNVVVGNVYDVKFSSYFAPYRKDGEKQRGYNLKTLFKYDIDGAWNKEESLKTVLSVYVKTTMAVTRYAYCNKGQFYDQTVYPHTDGSVTAPRKQNGALAKTERYGGYKSQKTAYFAIVESKDKKNGLIKTIEAIPVLTSYRARTDKNAILKYLQSYLKEPEILVEKVKIKQLVSYNGTPCWLAGITKSSIIIHNAVELFTDRKTDEYVKSLVKLAETDKNGLVFNKDADEYEIKTNRFDKVSLKIDRRQNTELYDMLTRKLDLPVYSGISAFKSFKNTLGKCRDAFTAQTVLNQTIVLLEILKFFKCNAALSNLTLIGASKYTGTTYINQNITDADFRIVHKSACGLVKRVRRV